MQHGTDFFVFLTVGVPGLLYAFEILLLQQRLHVMKELTFVAVYSVPVGIAFTGAVTEFPDRLFQRYFNLCLHARCESE